jgi:hypothetical protein
MTYALSLSFAPLILVPAGVVVGALLGIGLIILCKNH